MSSLQPLFDVKERLEYAAVAGTGLLGEDFRLQRAAENLKPLAAASPVFGKISAGLAKLLEAPAEERAGLLLDVLALADAVAYTQGTFGMEGDLEDLPTAGGTYQQISYGQMQPLLTALTTTGSGRMDIIQSSWDTHPAYFTDFRILPKLVAGLGDSYGEIADLNGTILKKLGAVALPLLKEGFDPAGKRDMARRVEVIAAIGGPEAGPWLREILPEAKKDVRTAVLSALGGDPDNTELLLELVKTERGGNRDAALQSLALQEGGAVRAFWEKELAKNSGSVKFLRDAEADWAGELVAAGLRERVEKMLSGGIVPVKDSEDFTCWCRAIGKKESPAMLDLWRWACGKMEAIDQLKTEKDKPVFAGVQLTDSLLYVLCTNGPGPVCDFCCNLWRDNPRITRYMIHDFLASMISLPAAAVYEEFSRYILVEEAPDRRTLNDVLLRAFTWVFWREDMKHYWIKETSDSYYTGDGLFGSPTREPLDPRWISRLTRAVYRSTPGQYAPFGSFSGGETIGRFDVVLMSLIDPGNPEHRALVIPYLRERLLDIPPKNDRGIDTGGVYTYCRYLLQLGGSPRGALGKAMARRPGRHYVYYLWQLLSEAAKKLPPEEVAGLLEEIEPEIVFRKNDIALAQKAIPYTAAALRAGKPFPDWDEWWSMR